MLTFLSIDLIGFATAVMLVGTLPQIYGHGVEVRQCLTPTGKLRFFVEHWHGNLSNAGVAGTMKIKDNAEAATKGH